MRTTAIVSLWLLLAACSVTDSDGDGNGTGGGAGEERFEGDDPGECDDGADNDRDGAFDCDDSDCSGAPVCGGTGGERDLGADFGLDLDPDAVTRPDVGAPDANEPDASAPDANEPDASEPDATEPDATEPDANEPDANEPDVGVPACAIARAAGRGSLDEASWRSFHTSNPLISLDGQESTGVGGAEIASYAWTVESRPTGAEPTFLGGIDPAVQAILLHEEGAYVFALSVTDVDGNRSCAPAYVDVVLGDPSPGLHVQLVWDTPGDRNPADDAGTDMDLHLLNTTMGGWNTSPADCYWENRSPDWGMTGSDLDDPNMDIDDLDGWGPENISYDAPFAGCYSVGVDYYDAHGFGASTATVRIFMGSEELGATSRELTNKQFWHVADICYPSTEVTMVNELFPGGIPEDL